MNTSVVAVASLTLSVLATLVSSLIAVRQSKLMRHTNLVPVVVDMFRDFRDPEFKVHMGYVQHSLWKEYDHATAGTSELGEEARSHVAPVMNFFNTIGLLVAQGVIDGSVPSSSMGGSILRAWSRIGPFIRTERAHRKDPNYSIYFEDLAVRALRLPPSKLKKRLGMRSMPLHWEMEGWEGYDVTEIAARFTPSSKPAS
jgi:hypothetical protein